MADQSALIVEGMIN